MKARQFTTIEQAGIIIAVAVIGIFLYMKFIGTPPGRQLRRLKVNYEKISVEVDRLRQRAETGAGKREVVQLQRKIEKERKKLKTAETRLAREEQVEQIAGKVVDAATGSGLIIKAFREIRDHNTLDEITALEKSPYPQRYYTMTVKGPFQFLTRFIGKIDVLPELVAVKNIAIEKIEDTSFVQADLCVCI